MYGTADPVRSAFDPERILAPLSHAKGLLLAVSGGPDSVALMLIAARWAGRRTVPIEVATVDHRLRSESRPEAEAVAGWAEALGFAHHLLSWDSEKPKTRLQERAREARYALLANCAARIGADCIVTGHHSDDQAETVLLRLTRGSGPAGLAGMAPLTRFGGVTIARPLLDLPKAGLVALCEAAGQPFFEDPSNDNSAFARTRLRALRGLFDVEGLDRPALLRLARRAARAEAALAEIAAATRLTLPARRTADGAQIAGEALAKLPDEIFLRILEAEVLALSQGRDHLRLDRLERAAADTASAIHENRVFATTLGDARIAVTSDGQLQISRTPARRRTKTDSA
ncbi:MAG TPA: tRNA lysidine(34) synthetase TilS [Beijerinckiaceae bacterium]|jgi:tRNA(Ile)-lysidine synthase|nr:tRNA lysidine(34) synthetase TilS [Beijerinckiaceae bacterium]